VKNGVDVEDEAAVAVVLDTLDIRLLPPQTADDDVRVLLNGEDVSREIRTPEAGMLASKVSALLPVRQKLTAMQQAMGRTGGLVAEGRDTGTVVFPDAAWKFFLDAPPEERARRRALQLREQGQEVDEQKLLAQIIERDRQDRERTIAPLVKAEDAVVIDSSNLSADEVAARMLAVVHG
jgi:cytidylate kinase